SVPSSIDTCVVFRVEISPTENTPPGYLFLCPWTDFQTEPGATSFRWPECPAYWSLDRLGGERLGPGEATRLGFPPIQLETYIWGQSWDATVYAGLRRFYVAKGFNPDTQDVARCLGFPLHQLLPGMDTSFDHAGKVAEYPDSFEPPVSRAFKILISVQLGLILFTVVWQAYEAAM
ncbi:hypothetical protein C8R46DRAFT_469105, partial [Mycena filopes]